MVQVAVLAEYLGLPVEYVVTQHIGCKHPAFVRMLSLGFFGFERAIEVINYEGNREHGTQASKVLQNKLRQDKVFCNGQGYLEVI
jgi:hypothetical protein